MIRPPDRSRTAAAVTVATVLLPLAIVPGVRCEDADRVAGSSATAPGSAPIVLFAPGYPVEVSVLEHAARFHWLDSLAAIDFPGGSAGKTVTAHREEFVRLLGPPTAADRDWLRRFAGVRTRFAERRAVEHRARGRADFSALLVAFLESPDETAAIARATGLVGPSDARTLAGAMDHFRSRYDPIWGDGRWLDGFLDSVRGARAERRLGPMLARMAALYGVDVPLDPPPRIVPMPTPPGYGTHASAHGRHLLIELRPGDRIADAAAVIAHENAHLLFARMAPSRREALERPFAAAGARGARAWATLVEALPTALGQGVFDRAFRRRAWSRSHPWYHRPEVDAYAKAIYPLVARAFRTGRTLDAALGRELLDAWPDAPGGRRAARGGAGDDDPTNARATPRAPGATRR